MAYVIKRMSDGAYVTRPGSPRSYTEFLENARRFPTHDVAESERCLGNERVFSVEKAPHG